MNVFSQLKRSSGAITAAMAALVCAAPASVNAAHVDGDVFLCFRATANQGSTTDYLVDLGPATQFTAARGQIDVNLGGDIVADLVAAYGATWNTRSDLRWSVVGVQKAAGNGFAANTIFASRREPAAGTPSTPWLRPSDFAAGTPAGKIQSMGSRYDLGSTSNGGIQTVSTHNPNALLQATGISTSYAQFQPGGSATTGATAFSYFDDTTGIEATFTGGVDASAVDFYEVASGAGNADLIGGFQLTATGQLLFAKNVALLGGIAAGTELYAKGGVVPTNVGIPTGATWTTFGLPAVNDLGQVAFLGKWKAPAPNKPGAGIFVDGKLVVKVGDATGLPGVTFKNFKDPVIDNRGHVAMIANLTGTGISTLNDLAVATNGRNGTIEILAEENSPAPGADGATFKNFTAVSIKGEVPPPVGPLVLPTGSESGIVILGSLTKLTGTPAVDTHNDTGAWWLPAGGTNLTKLIREGDPADTTATPPTFKSFSILKAVAASPSVGRGQIAGDECLLQVVLSNNAQAQVDVTPTAFTYYAQTGGSLGSTTITDAKWSKMNFQSSDAAGTHVVTSAALLVVKGGMTTAQTAHGIFATADGGTSWEPVAQTQSADAPGMGTGAKFSAFRDPVNSPVDGGLAFLATAKGGTSVTTANDNGLWWKPDGGTLQLVAREGSEPPSAPGAKWKTFTSIALPGSHTGPLFTALLEKGLAGAPGPGGVVAANDMALYGVDGSGAVLQIIREGQALPGVPGKTVKTFAVLKVVAGTAGSRRCFNTSSSIVALVTFTDNATHLVTTGLVELGLPF